MLWELLGLGLLVFGVWWFFNNSRSIKNLPPGPNPIFPLVGNIPQLISYKRKTNFETLDKIVEDYGKIVYLRMGMIDQVIIQDFELAREVLTSESWVDRPFDQMIGDRSFGKPLGVIFSSGHNWREMRRFTTRTLRDFGFGRNKSMESVIDEEVSLLIETMDKIAVSQEELGMRQFFTISILNLLWSMVAGFRFAHDDKRLHRLIQLLDEVTKSSAVESGISNAYPFLWTFVKWTKPMRNRSHFHEQTQLFFMELIEERRISGTYKQDDPKDFMDVFLKEIDQKSGEKGENLYTEEQFIVTLYDLFTAGAETTSNTLEFAIQLVARYPKVQEKVRQEIHGVLGKTRRPTVEDRKELPYTEATLLEIQRLASVLPVLIRSATENTTLAGYHIPKGTLAGINFYGIHHDPKLWNNPMECMPERFLDSEGKVTNSNKILPFGLGKRVCLGEALAKSSLFIYFSTILQNYEIRFPSQEPISTDPIPGFTLSPPPFSVKLRKMK